MNRFQQVYNSRRKSLTPNITFGGLGNNLITPFEFVQNTNLSESDILYWGDDGQDLQLYIDTSIDLISFGSQRDNPTIVQQLIGNNLTSIIDQEGLITYIGSNTLHSQTQPLELVLNGVIHIDSEGLRDVRYCHTFTTTNSLTTIGTAACTQLGKGSGQALYPDISGIIGDCTGLSNSNIAFHIDAPLVTGLISLSQCGRAIQFPFPNASGIPQQFLRNCGNLEGIVSLVNVTTETDLYFSANNAIKMEKLLMPNMPSAIGIESGSFRDCNSLNEVDFRSCTSFKRNGSEVPNVDMFSGMDKSVMVAHAHISQKTINTGNPQRSFASIIYNGGTVNWYNSDGSLNSVN